MVGKNDLYGTAAIQKTLRKPVATLCCHCATGRSRTQDRLPSRLYGCPANNQGLALGGYLVPHEVPERLRVKLLSAQTGRVYAAWDYASSEQSPLGSRTRSPSSHATSQLVKLKRHLWRSGGKKM